MPKIFRKLLKPVLSTLRKQGNQTINYQDNLFLVGNTCEECLEAVEDTNELLSKLGFDKFVENLEKFVFVPTQRIKYLGFILYPKGMTVPLTLEYKKKNCHIY